MMRWFVVAVGLALLGACGDSAFDKECECHQGFRDTCAYSPKDNTCQCTKDGKVVTPDDPRCN